MGDGIVQSSLSHTVPRVCQQLNTSFRITLQQLGNGAVQSSLSHTIPHVCQQLNTSFRITLQQLGNGVVQSSLSTSYHMCANNLIFPLGSPYNNWGMVQSSLSHIVPHVCQQLNTSFRITLQQLGNGAVQSSLSNADKHYMCASVTTLAPL